MRMPRGGWVTISKALVERGPADVVLEIGIDAALTAAGMTRDDSYYLRLAVVEMPAEDADCPLTVDEAVWYMERE